MGPFKSTDTTHRTFGILRKNVLLLVCLLGLVTYSVVYNSYSSIIPDLGSQQNQMNKITMATAMKHPNTEIIAKETAAKRISLDDSLAELDSLPTSTAGADTANAIEKVDDIPKVKTVGRLSSLKQPNTEIIAKETAAKRISLDDSLAELDSLPTSTAGADTAKAIEKVDDIPKVKTVGRLSSLKHPNTEIIAKETAAKRISLDDSLAELDSLSTSTTGADTAKAIDKVDDLSEMKSVGSSRPNELVLAKLETSKRYIPERQCSSREYSVPFPFGGCNVTAATPSNSVGSAETCGLCGQNKFVRFLTEVGEHLKEKKGKECSKLAIFGVAFGSKYGSMMMKNEGKMKEMNKRHGKCFFTFVLGKDDDGATQSQNYTQRTHLGIKIPVPKTILPYKNMRRNTKLFKMYGGLMVFSFAERLIWQDAKLDQKLHHTQDYNKYFKEHIDKNGVCAALFSLPKHPWTLGEMTWRNVDGPHFKDHCNLLTSTSGIKRALPLTDSRQAIQMQCDYYQKLNSTSYGSSLDSGLVDSALIAWDMRTERCRKFNKRLSCTWLDETQCYGDRDQVSFPQAIRTMELHEPHYVSPAESMTQDKLFVSDDEQQKPLVSAMLLL
jgi:hypothetical protein